MDQLDGLSFVFYTVIVLIIAGAVIFAFKKAKAPRHTPPPDPKNPRGH